MNTTTPAPASTPTTPSPTRTTTATTTTTTAASADANEPAGGVPALSGIGQLKAVLSDERFDCSTRLLRLQGWRGTELTCAIGAGHAHRLAPGFCAIGAAAIAFTGSAWLAVVLMSTALVGIFARNHPVETLYNAVGSRMGRSICTHLRSRGSERSPCSADQHGWASQCPTRTGSGRGSVMGSRSWLSAAALPIPPSATT